MSLGAAGTSARATTRRNSADDGVHLTPMRGCPATVCIEASFSDWRTPRLNVSGWALRRMARIGTLRDNHIQSGAY